MSTLVLGSIGIDDIETPFDKAEGILGGSASYAAVAGSFFGPSRMVSIVGEDFSDDQRRLFTSRGIDLNGLKTAPGKTFRWGGRYAMNFDDRETLFTDLNVLRSSIRSCRRATRIRASCCWVTRIRRCS